MMMRRRRRTLRLGLVIVTGFVLAVAGCTHAPKSNVAPPPAAAPDDEQIGIVSYYGASFEGRRTASGATYRGRALTAAHRTLPFGTRVRVTNLANGKRAEVVINDRGPFVKGRIIDVSRQAAEELDLIRAGVARARIEVIDPDSED